ncbi:hypothetical protein [Bacillus sp. JJ722]|uniref:hypothetical protein n=1 Tax=Bacillus sp. JJ722 TaxID=3122973 RepID=UPI002FFECA54
MDKIVILEEFRQEWESEELEEVIKCWDKGWSYKDIAHRFDINETESMMVLLHLDVYGKLKERKGGIFGSVDNDNVQYDSCHRIKFNELLHFKQSKTWSEEEMEYLCKFHESDDMQSIALSLGRTSGSVNEKLKALKKSGKYDYYKTLNENWCANE